MMKFLIIFILSIFFNIVIALQVVQAKQQQQQQRHVINKNKNNKNNKNNIGRKYNPIPSPESTLTCFAWRITFLTDGLIRTERSKSITKDNVFVFDNLPTLAVVNRQVSPIPKFSVTKNSSSVCQISSKRMNFTIYPPATNSKTTTPTRDEINNEFIAYIQSVNGKIQEYQPYDDISNRSLNLGGVWLQGSLDCYATPEACFTCKDPLKFKGCSPPAPGLLTKSGFNVYDDTDSSRLSALLSDGGWLLPLDGFSGGASKTDLLDLYLFSYPTLDYKEWLREISDVFGRVPIPPKNAFGIWYSREYTYSQQEFVSEVVEGYANHSLPLDIAVLDNGWHSNDEKDWMCPGETWNTKLFPDPPKFLSWLQNSSNTPQKHKIPLFLNIHLQWGINQCQSKYQDMCKYLIQHENNNNHQHQKEKTEFFCKFNATLLCGLQDKVWVDALFKEVLNPLGNDYWWTDDAAQALGCTGFATTTPQLWSNAVFDHQIRETKKQRSMVLSRFGGIGNHRYGIGFSGDAFQTFSTLKYEVETTPLASNVLFGYISNDIGGFHWLSGSQGTRNTSNIESCFLYLRWLQFGVFSPIFRTHCSGCERRVWLFKYFSEEMKEAIKLRAILVPYIYTAASLNGNQAGISLMRPMYYLYSDVGIAYETPSQYFFGSDNLFVAPVTMYNETTPPNNNNNKNNNNNNTQSVWIPEGDWLNFDGSFASTSNTTTSGGGGGGFIQLSHDNCISNPSCLPIFIRSGMIIPTTATATATTSAQENPTHVKWILFPNFVDASRGTWSLGDTGVLYEDDGISFDYERNTNKIASEIFVITNCNYLFLSPTSMKINVDMSQQIEILPPFRQFSFQLRGFLNQHQQKGDDSSTPNGKKDTTTQQQQQRTITKISIDGIEISSKNWNVVTSPSNKNNNLEPFGALEIHDKLRSMVTFLTLTVLVEWKEE